MKPAVPKPSHDNLVIFKVTPNVSFAPTAPPRFLDKNTYVLAYVYVDDDGDDDALASPQHWWPFQIYLLLLLNTFDYHTLDWILYLLSFHYGYVYDDVYVGWISNE